MKYSSVRRIIGGLGLSQPGSTQDLWYLERDWPGTKEVNLFISDEK